MPDDDTIPARLDRARVRARFSAASSGYDAAARLQAVVRAELLQRAGELRIAPKVVLDLGAGTGHAARALKQRYPASLVIAADLAPGMLVQAGALLGWRERWFGGGWGHRFERVAADTRALPLASGCAQLAFSNLMLQWCDDLAPAFGEIARVLEPGGAFAFATFGPATLQELRAAWATVDDLPHVHRFLDMHDVGDALMRAGFEQPVLDVDTHQLDYPGVIELMRDLQRIGAVNADRDRRRSLLGRGTLAKLTATYEPLRGARGLPSTWEVVYGLAWAPAMRRATAADAGAAADATLAIIPLDQIGRRRRDAGEAAR
jgi:malonyl-CoA O-methyltransferase